jgi:DNA-binding GntR family transcriptional regulator
MRLSEKAYRLIRDAIITLKLPPSSLINEQDLMEQFNLGRTPIREALQRLGVEGFVTVVPRRGTFVADIHITDLQKIFEVRIELTGFCARLAAQRISDAQILELERVLDGLGQVTGGDVEALIDIDWRFQELLYAAADNQFLAEMLNRLYALSLRLWYLVLDRLGDVRDAIGQHSELLEALRARDGARAEACIQNHIAQFQREIKAVL